MFSVNKCLVPTCTNSALSDFDQYGNIIKSNGYCLEHIPDPGNIQAKIFDYIKNHDMIIGLNASGIIFKDIDLSNKKFFGCDFSDCTFQNVKAENTIFKISVFDFAFFFDCNFIKSRIQFTSFSCCTLTHTIFNFCDILQCNFNGARVFQCSLDNCDFFSSRFIKATLSDTSFRNCNLKKTIFSAAKRENVSFKMSNTREAIFGTLRNPLDSASGDALDFGNPIVDGDMQ